jgi:hypothetical protein
MRDTIARMLDPFIAAALVAPAVVMRRARKAGLDRFPVTQRTLKRVGILPVRRHYYEPQIDPDGLTPETLQRDRPLPGIDLRRDAQRDLLRGLRFQGEAADIPFARPSGADGVYWWDNTYFGRMDGSVWYSMLRALRPRAVIEIGSGFSTLLARRALQTNAGDGGTVARHVCIEPYEHGGWLGQCGAEVVRERVERIDPSLFSILGPGDVLFIDSSHVLRPGGDVTFEILQVLPRLAPGVVVHVHDIFTPQDYPYDWLFRRNRLWNEQYMLEALLSMNPSYEVVLGVWDAWHTARTDLEAACVPTGGQTPGTSFYIRRTA